jgi:carbon monoxide dehydrogenase subunit G
MKIANDFEVARPVDAVWEFFQDVPSVAQCLPGAELTDDKGEGVFAGAVSVKLGPMSATFEGEATVTPDAAARSVKISGTGTDRKGGSRGKVLVDYRLDPTDAGTRVMVDADVTLSGAAARFGRTKLIEEMSTRLIGEFVACLEKKLGAATPEEAASVSAGDVKGVSLLVASLSSWIGKLFKRLLGRQ